MGAFTLRFDDCDIERQFRENYWTSVLPFARFCCFWAIVLWTVFGAMDAVAAGNALQVIWTIRFLIALPLGFVLLAAAFFCTKSARNQVILYAAVYFVGAGAILAMIASLEPPASYSYYAGITLTVFSMFIFSQFRFAAASLCGIVVIFGYEITSVFLIEIPRDVLISNTFFLVFGAFIGMIASHVIERYRRLDFLHRCELSSMSMQLEELSLRDPLTGLYNRRQLADQIRNSVDTFRLKGIVTSIMLIDLDDFKGINDRFGHLAGDEILKRTARLILDFLRKTDRAYRYGGDEFLVLLPNTSLSEAKTLADRLVGGLGGHNHETARFATVCGISVGVASLNVSTRDADDFLIAADRALYAAKQQGKGCVVAVGGTS
jgi:diguanylate cyclase (GGDEF)-like protein